MMIFPTDQVSTPNKESTSPGLAWARWAFSPSPFTVHEWRRWGRPWRLSLWPFHLGIALLWISPVAVLMMGPSRLIPAGQVCGVMVAVPSLIVFVLSLAFVFSWWPRSRTQDVFGELLLTPTPPIEFVRSALLPPRLLMALGCVPPLALAPAADLIAWWTGRSYFSGDPATTLFALNCLLSAWLDAPMMIWLLASLRSRTRALLATAVVILPLHAAYFVHAGLPFGHSFDPRLRTSLTGLALCIQIVLYAMVVMDLPRRVQTWARECAGRNG